ncbi:LacI family transcriptional regulator [Bacillus sp. AFS076308]|uniref:LacI family DNA-binding transcriptional regulator n=1 Tax=unclassified Bacillus (in: firmicutes) TaxID=185979 RepID=UPI000BFA72B7|nr:MULTISPECIES: LacI family DNA-binding transcriptional regulator [unclassified Bacillus (in: firmicutes)]PFO02645.1 LacI family transcriptional regulator [Bacillus sp. AFS076308]PGV50445.1 LacI family transcriptional regulator [Bacillus sp. AFS037270]
MKPTIYDVAEKAGVSIATVSKVINDTGRISEETRNKVLKIMGELEYQPSSVATALTGKKTFTIGVLVPDISNAFFAEVARALENNAREMGYSIILCSTDYQIEREHDYLELLQKKQVDGIIIATEPEDWKAYKSLQKRAIPHLMFSVDSLRFSSHIVTTDDVRGGYMAGRYLLDMGHREVAIIAEQNRASGRMRLEGFKKSLTDKGVALKDEWTLNAMSKLDDAKAAARKILQMENRPTAVFASTDLIAAIFIKEARKAHIRIPNEISIVGFDDTIYAELTEPGLTTIAQPKQELAKFAMDQLLKLIKDPRIPQQRIMLSPRLVERKSVRNLNNL